MTAQIFYNPRLEPISGMGQPGREPLGYHARLPGYAPTPLVSAPALARALGIGELWIKDESSRLSLPSFKMLGASWAVYRAIVAHLGIELPEWKTVEELRRAVAPYRPLTLTAATDGNHGRAVARMAALLGLDAHIFVPDGMSPARIEAIRSEGATVTVVDGTYDEAVARSAEEASERVIVVSDTSWPGYDEIPRRVVEGYSTIFWEIEDELARQRRPRPDLVVVQIGVGALAAAAALHYGGSANGSKRPTLLAVEPVSAACMLRSMEAGDIVTLPGPQDSIMVGLNCGTPSLVAWPLVSRTFDAFVAIEDSWSRQSMRALADLGVVAGETGAAGLAGLTMLLTTEHASEARRRLQIGEQTSALVIITEGATDPQSYEEITGRTPAAVAALTA